MRRFVAPVLAAAMLAAPALAAASPELSTTDQLNTRRYVAAGERAYVMGFQDGSFQAQGWHITGEMGGVWSQPQKLADGVWFGVGDAWLPAATRFTSGWGYTRMDFPDAAGLKVSRTDLGLDDSRAVLFGLRLVNPGTAAKTVPVKVDVHSELLGAYPWTSTTPNAGDANGVDSGAYTDGVLSFADGARQAVVGSNVRADGGETGPGHWGPVSAPVTCTDDTMFTCD